MDYLLTDLNNRKATAMTHLHHLRGYPFTEPPRRHIPPHSRWAALNLWPTHLGHVDVAWDVRSRLASNGVTDRREVARITTDVLITRRREGGQR